MPDRKSLIPIFEWLVIAALVLVAPEGRANSVLDLAEFPPETNIAMHMEGFEADAGAIPGPEQALARGNWVPLSMVPRFASQTKGAGYIVAESHIG